MYIQAKYCDISLTKGLGVLTKGSYQEQLDQIILRRNQNPRSSHQIELLQALWPLMFEGKPRAPRYVKGLDKESGKTSYQGNRVKNDITTMVAKWHYQCP